MSVMLFFFGLELIPLASWKDLDYCFDISVPFFPLYNLEGIIVQKLTDVTNTFAV